MNEYIEQTFLLNNKFYWTFVKWENKRNRRKMNRHNQFVFDSLKKMKSVIHEWWTNKMNKKPKTPISTVQIIGYFIGKHLFWESLCKLSVTVDFILSLECCWSFWEIWNLYLLSKFKIFRLNSFNIKKFLL